MVDNKKSVCLVGHPYLAAGLIGSAATTIGCMLASQFLLLDLLPLTMLLAGVVLGYILRAFRFTQAAAAGVACYSVHELAYSFSGLPGYLRTGPTPWPTLAIDVISLGMVRMSDHQFSAGPLFVPVAFVVLVLAVSRFTARFAKAK